MGGYYRSRYPLFVRNCTICGVPFETRYKKKMRCRTNCGQILKERKVLKGEKVKNHRPTGVTGAIAELKVAAVLMERGWEVFRALAPHAGCDLVAIKGSKMWLIEVRTGYESKDGKVCIGWNLSKRLDRGHRICYAAYIANKDKVRFIRR